MMLIHHEFERTWFHIKTSTSKDKLQILKEIYNIKENNNSYSKNNLEIKIYDCNLIGINKQIKITKHFSFDCLIIFKLNNEFSLEKKYGISMPEELLKKELSQLELNIFKAKIITSFLLDYNKFYEKTKMLYDIYLFEKKYIFSMSAIIGTTIFDISDFQVFKYIRQGNGYMIAGKGDKDSFLWKKYVVKYKDVFVTDKYLTTLIPKDFADNSPNYFVEDEKSLCFCDLATKFFFDKYDINKHVATLKK